MKIFSALFFVLLVPSLTLAVELVPGESFGCNNVTYTCRNQTCNYECLYENCTSYIMDEWNKTGSACDRMCNYYDDLHERLDSYNESYYQEKISEWEDTFSQMNANVTDIQGELDGCYAKNNEYEKVKNEWYSNPAIVFGLGAVGCFLFLNKNKIFDRVSNTTGTEGGFEPTEGV